jgi:hypothetical protein
MFRIRIWEIPYNLEKMAKNALSTVKSAGKTGKSAIPPPPMVNPLVGLFYQAMSIVNQADTL